MRAVDIIAKKRNGGEIEPRELEFLIGGFVRKEIPDYQLAAFLMAVFFQGMTFPEMASLTSIMMRSGEVFDLSDVPGIKVDKHSTGGVGDKVSLILAPLVASAGVPVPMVSGRGLGHTGGTLDKLEAIPGFNTRLDQKTFIRQIRDIGAAIIGQSDHFVPADKGLYALRDVTATVESIPLITASIISKKVASGADAFVLDVKTGSGAFMDTLDKARALARSLIGVLKELGRNSIALITDMNQPLGKAVGNSLELVETIETLQNRGPADLVEICLELGGQMLVLGEITANVAEGRRILQRKLETGEALELFRLIIEHQGGDPSVVDLPSRIDIAPHTKTIHSPQNGYIAGYENRLVGVAACMLGAGRLRAEDDVDVGVGLISHKRIGEPVCAGEPVFTVYYRKESLFSQAEHLLKKSFLVSAEPVQSPKLIYEEIRQGRG
ncbi:MAG TPA: thymidine phosphorylase [Candidatus Sumerlaeota bacterium]|nr:thymidine phosphorylase [Candidatus Sumerlaeota bacterium]